MPTALGMPIVNRLHAGMQGPRTGICGRPARFTPKLTTRLGVGALSLLCEDVTALTGTLLATMPTSSSTPSGNTRTRPPGETSEARIAKALAHPLRARILQRLGERVASPGDLAVELSA